LYKRKPAPVFGPIHFKEVLEKLLQNQARIFEYIGEASAPAFR